MSVEMDKKNTTKNSWNKIGRHCKVWEVFWKNFHWWTFELQNSRWQLIYEMSSSKYYFPLIWFRNIFLEQKSSCNNKKMTIFSFSNPILLGSTNIFMDNTFFLEIRRLDLIEVILCIITPKLLDSHSKSSFDHFVIIEKYNTHIWFLFEKKDSKYSSAMIYKWDKPSRA